MIHAPISTKDVERSMPMTLHDACHGCRTGAPLPLAITMAFQPIVDVTTGSVFAMKRWSAVSAERARRRFWPASNRT